MAFDLGAAVLSFRVDGLKDLDKAMVRLDSGLSQVGKTGTQSGVQTGRALGIATAGARELETATKQGAATIAQAKAQEAKAIDDNVAKRQAELVVAQEAAGKSARSAELAAAQQSAAAARARQLAEAQDAAGVAATDAGERGSRAGRIVRDALDGARSAAVTLRDGVGQVRDEFTSLNDEGKNAAREVGTGLAAASATIMVAIGSAIVKNAEYNKALSETKAVTQASAADTARLRDVTLDLGAASVFTAREAAEGATELGKAGVKTSEIIGGGLKGSLDLAAAGQLGVADSAEIAATAMTQFKLSGQDIPHLADLLAAGANTAQGSVQDLGYALKQSGLVASQMGIGVDDAITTLTGFAKAGLLGSDAGTSFRTMLLSLANPSGEAADMLEKYNVQAYDAQGNFVGMESLAGQLESRMSSLSMEERNHALAVIFGTDAIRGANVLVGLGAKGYRELADETNRAGFAAKYAAEMQDNLAGDVEKLGGALDSALIKTGEGANGVLRPMAQILTTLIDLYGQAPAPIQQTAIMAGLLAAGLLAVGGAALVGVPKVVEFRAALAVLETQMPRTTAVARGLTSFFLGPWGIALAAAAAGVMFLMDAQRKYDEGTREVVETLDAQTGALTDNTRAMVAKKLADEGGFEVAKKSGVAQKELVDAILEGGDAWDTVQGKIRGYTNGAGLFDITAANQRDSMNALAAQVRDSSTEWDRQRTATEDATIATGEAADATEDTEAVLASLSGTAQSATTDIEALADTILNFGKAQLDANDAARGFEAAVDDQVEALQRQKDAYIEANGTIDGFNASLDIGTAEGRENSAALDAIAESALRNASSLVQMTGSQKEGTAAIQAGRDRLIDALGQFNITGQAAEDYADKLGLIPSNITTAIEANTAPATSKLDTWIRQNNGRSIFLNAQVNTVGPLKSGYVFSDQGANGFIRSFAQGGFEPARAMVVGPQQAQIRAGGNPVIWAEHETQGESFIPHSVSKRRRAESIMDATAKLFGGQYIPAGDTRRAADGLMSGGIPLGGSLKGLKIAGDLRFDPSTMIATIDGMIVDALDSENDTQGRGYRG